MTTLSSDAGDGSPDAVLDLPKSPVPYKVLTRR